MVPEAVDHAEGMACPSPAPPPILPGTGPRSGPKAQLGGGPGCSRVDTAHGQSLCGNRCQINTCLWAGGHAGREAGCVRAEALEGRARLTGWSGCGLGGTGPHRALSNALGRGGTGAATSLMSAVVTSDSVSRRHLQSPTSFPRPPHTSHSGDPGLDSTSTGRTGPGGEGASG